MAPKRPAKRAVDDDDGRPSKKGGKGKKEATYETYDEALDGELLELESELVAD